MNTQKAIFLDRDGIINKEIGKYVSSLQEVELNYFLLDFIAVAYHNHFKIVIITNQGGIQKKLYHVDLILEINNLVDNYLLNQGARVHRLYFCSHHPELCNCLCRKPETLLFQRAIHQLNVDVSKSLMLGDRHRDILPAKKMGLHTVLVDAEPIPEADLTFDTIQQAMPYIYAFIQ